MVWGERPAECVSYERKRLLDPSRDTGGGERRAKQGIKKRGGRRSRSILFCGDPSKNEAGKEVLSPSATAKQGSIRFSFSIRSTPFSLVDTDTIFLVLIVYPPMKRPTIPRTWSMFLPACFIRHLRMSIFRRSIQMRSNVQRVGRVFLGRNRDDGAFWCIEESFGWVC